MLDARVIEQRGCFACRPFVVRFQDRFPDGIHFQVAVVDFLENFRVYLTGTVLAPRSRRCQEQ